MPEGSDLGGAIKLAMTLIEPHRSPDDVEVASPHLHIYREGYGDKWAFPLPADSFPNMNDLWLTLEDFMRYCNVTEPPFIRRGLFS